MQKAVQKGVAYFYKVLNTEERLPAFKTNKDAAEVRCVLSRGTFPF